jgi:hypothetical protein
VVLPVPGVVGAVGAGGFVVGGVGGTVGFVGGGVVGAGGFVAGGGVGFVGGAGAAGVFFTFFIAWPRLRLLSTISVFKRANGTLSLRDAFTAAMNCPWLRNPALASSSVIPAGSLAVRRAFCSGLREMRAEIAFGSGAGVVVAGGVVALPDSVPVVVPVLPVDVPVALVDDVVTVDVDAVARLRPDATFAVLSDFALPDAFDNPFVALSDLVLPDTFGDPVVLGDAVVVGLFEPPFATRTPDFGLFGPWAAAGATVVTVANDSANAIASG